MTHRNHTLFLIACIAACVAAPATIAQEKDTLLVLRASGRQFDEFVNGFNAELGDSFKTLQLLVDSINAPVQIENKLLETRPKAVILLDNKAINAFRQYQSHLPDSAAVVPSISCMGVSISDAISGLRNAAGISYEIPIVTSVVSLRSLTGTPIRRIGIVHRASMKAFITTNTEYCKKEKIEVLTQEISNQTLNIDYTVKKALKELFERDSVDALWVPNDIVLLRPQLIRDIWIPLIARYRKPVIVGVESLVNPALEFGTLAITPDQAALGSQAAQLLLTARDNGWKFKSVTIEQPIAVLKTGNLRQIRDFFPDIKLRLNELPRPKWRGF